MRQPRVEAKAHEFAQVARNRDLARSLKVKVSPRGDHAAAHVTADGSNYNDLASLASRYGFSFVEKSAGDVYVFRYTGGDR